MERSLREVPLEIETTRANEKLLAAVERMPEHLQPELDEYCRQAIARLRRSGDASQRAALGSW